MISLNTEFYKTGDEVHIVALFEQVFGKPMDASADGLQHWRWEYQSNPQGLGIMALCWAEDRLVGQFAAIPMELLIDGAARKGARSQDSMTAPDYQGQGVFSRLAEHLTAEITRQGFRAIFGFPNGNSVYGFTHKLGWKKVCTPPVYLKITNPGAILQKRFRLPAWIARTIDVGYKGLAIFGALRLPRSDGTAITIHRASRFDSWADDLWAQCKQQHRVWVARSQQYLNWRYVDKPGQTYEIYVGERGGVALGYIVIARAESALGPTTFVMDILAPAEACDIRQCLVEHVLTLARSRRDVAISALIAPEARSKRDFKRAGFFHLPAFMFPQQLHFAAKAFDASTAEVIRDPSAWGLSWGDDDVL